MLICRSPEIDVIVDVTGSVEFGAHVILEAFAHGKHVVLMNAEVDATIGPILQVYARRARRHPVRLRRRRAGPADEPVSAGSQGLGLIAARRGQRQGPAGSVPQPDDAAGLGRALGARTRRWSPRSPTARRSASSRRSWPTPPASRSSPRACRAATCIDGSIMDIHQLYDIDAAPRARRRRRLHGRAAADEGRSSWPSTPTQAAPLPRASTRWARARSTRSGFPTTSCTSRRRSPSPGWSSSATTLAPPLGGPVVEVCAVAKRDLRGRRGARRVRRCT